MRGYDAFDKSNYGITIMHCACRYGKVEIVHHFVENYPLLLGLRDIVGNSPFRTAINTDSVEVLQYLVSRLCNVLLDKDNDGRSLLKELLTMSRT